jgi:uncharacterized protein YodC (DUF2158 family)
MRSETEFVTADAVRVRQTGAIGVVCNARVDECKNLVEFDGNAATREWFMNDELELVARVQDESGSRFIPERSIMA